MSIVRRTMKFMVPLTIESLGRTDLTGRSLIPVYLNPTSFSLQDGKIISESLTKGGYVIQYWGEQLGEIQVAGTTGSGGIEAINILKAVYRNEITQFNNLLLERALTLDDVARKALSNTSTATAAAGISTILDEITSGGFSNIIDGTKSVIEEITQAALGITESNPAKVELIPTLGAFATNMILYWQGEKFVGYFKNFRSDENSSAPGHFDYQFTFMVIKRSGVRTNFMPWHRKPYDAAGQPVSASIPGEGQALEELNFPTSTQQNLLRGQENKKNPGTGNSVSSRFSNSQASSSNDPNQVPLNRSGFIRGK